MFETTNSLGHFSLVLSMVVILERKIRCQSRYGLNFAPNQPENSTKHQHKTNKPENVVFFCVHIYTYLYVFLVTLLLLCVSYVMNCCETPI